MTSRDSLEPDVALPGLDDSFTIRATVGMSSRSSVFSEPLTETALGRRPRMLDAPICGPNRRTHSRRFAVSISGRSRFAP
jgi:hypothetical protein